jgi:hypothetical protein
MLEASARFGIRESNIICVLAIHRNPATSAGSGHHWANHVRRCRLSQFPVFRNGGAKDPGKRVDV